jgi:lipopolysaccharide cholinephosphotransferase
MTFGIGRGSFFISWGGQYGIKKETLPLDVFFPLKTAAFEGKQYPVPNQMEVYLNQIYGGDYMELPPEEKRTAHSVELINFDTTEC